MIFYFKLLKQIIFLILIYILSQVVNAHNNEKCVLNLQASQDKNKLLDIGPTIVIESSKSILRLISNVLLILLNDVFGFNVQLLKTSYTFFNTEEILRKLSIFNESIESKYVINVELFEDSYMQPSFKFSPIGLSIKDGWYIPKYAVEKFNNSLNIQLLSLEIVASEFNFVKMKHLLVTSSELNYCERLSRGKCINGIWYQQNSVCLLYPERCAILLVDSVIEYSLSHNLMTSIIDSNLAVGIYWVENNLEELIKKCIQNNIFVLFYLFEPSTFLFGEQIVKLSPIFPNKYKEINILKWATSSLKSQLTEVSNILSRFILNSLDLENLIKEFLVHNMENIAACKWLQNNPEKLNYFLSLKKTMFLGGMVPIGGQRMRESGVIPAMWMAIEHLNKNSLILPDLNLGILIEDTEGSGKKGIIKYMQFINNQTHPIIAIIGPAGNEPAIAITSLARIFYTPVVSYAADAIELSNKKNYPYFFRTFPNSMHHGQIYKELFKRWNWEYVALLAEDHAIFPDFQQFLKSQFSNANINVLHDSIIMRDFSFESYINMMNNLKNKQARIIILTSFEDVAINVFCAASKLQMTAKEGYVWFIPEWFTNKWWHIDNKVRNRRSIKMPCNEYEIMSAIHTSFYLANSLITPPDSRIIGNITLANWKEEYNKKIAATKLSVSQFATHAYDAIMMYALSLHQLISKDSTAISNLKTSKNIQRLTQYMSETHFTGASGKVQFLGADRTSEVIIQQIQDEIIVRVGEFTPSINENSSMFNLILKNDIIIWATLDGFPPSDGRLEPKKCIIERFRVLIGVKDCEMAIVCANIFGFIGLICFMLILFIIIKKRYDAKVKNIRNQVGFLEPKSIRTFDQEWEVARSQIVLNRKLGEGAFGTVYGGEAYLNDTWMAVAVKTLKIGSNNEEKLDFLSESDLMKKFNHDNIVQLLGVCTIGEPIYAIMEFMLHGDLKTFLLSRRQLVNEESKESEDVKPLGLTKMALGVAKGLQYLHELKYVHRDIACRNCLVHAGKAVKIGDFGMTRRLYESDYYRFNRRGMFPVRWMAPESLLDGIFSSSSDIWSYGVLLFEIMTFGSFPYQGLSNRQVLNYVKAGNRITLPKNCDILLIDLIRSCWESDASLRPSIDNIISTFETNINFIKPCIDSSNSACLSKFSPTEDDLELRKLKPRSHPNRTLSLDQTTPLINNVNSLNNELRSPTSFKKTNFSTDIEIPETKAFISSVNGGKRNSAGYRLSNIGSYLKSSTFNRGLSFDGSNRQCDLGTKKSEGLMFAARYDGGKLIGRSDIYFSSLEDRLPTIPVVVVAPAPVVELPEVNDIARDIEPALRNIASGGVNFL